VLFDIMMVVARLHGRLPSLAFVGFRRTQRYGAVSLARQTRRWKSIGERRLRLNTGASMYEALAWRKLACTNTKESTRPALGFGTFQDPEAQEEAVFKALQLGYRHIDTAKVYGTERQTGNAIKRSGVPREEIFLVTKLWMNSHHPDDVEACLNGSLEKLETDYVDVLMMHYPGAFAR
jgi:hypothetical protein